MCDRGLVANRDRAIRFEPSVSNNAINCGEIMVGTTNRVNVQNISLIGNAVVNGGNGNPGSLGINCFVLGGTAGSSAGSDTLSNWTISGNT